MGEPSVTAVRGGVPLRSVPNDQWHCIPVLPDWGADLRSELRTKLCAFRKPKLRPKLCTHLFTIRGADLVSNWLTKHEPYGVTVHGTITGTDSSTKRVPKSITNWKPKSSTEHKSK